MKLYHYSKDLYTILKNRLKIGSSTDKEDLEQKEWNKKTNGPGVYNGSISFFIDPLPLELLGRIYGKGHHTWFDGNELYEYVIDTDALDKDITYSVVETPMAVKMLDETEWVDTDEFLIEYKKKLNALKVSAGETGNSRSKLETELSKYKDKTRSFYLEASRRSDFKEHFDKYAANVPHVMLYPDSGAISIESVNMVKVGSNSRRPIKVALESLEIPSWAKW